MKNKFANKTKDRSMLEQAIDSVLWDTCRKIRENTHKINTIAKEQRGLKELRHVLMIAKKECRKGANT